MDAKTSLKANVVANYAGQLYATAIGVLLLPPQVKALGAEAYGLVGFFAVMTGWLQLLDLGLGATLVRETAKFRARALDQDAYRRLLRAIEFLFAGLGAVVATLVLVCSGVIARRWLHPEALEPATVAKAVALMGLVFAFRWQATLARSVLIGMERLVWVNAVTAGSATLRSAGVLLALRWVAPTPTVFFIYQAILAALELAILRFSVHRILSFPKAAFERPDFAPLRHVGAFSLRIALAGVAWTGVTQLDKLLLSSFLPLSEYAWFSLAVAAATGINVLAGPIGQAVQPRLTYWLAASNRTAFQSTYSDATQMLSAIALTASFVSALGGRHLLWAWTGDAALAQRLAPIFALYALGNGLLALVSMTYYLQVAHGDLRLHLIGNLAFAAVLVPIVVFATTRAGMLGAGTAWFGANAAYFLVWSAIVHRHLAPNIHVSWLLRDVGLPGAAGFLTSLSLCLVHWSSLSRFETTLALGTLGCVSLAGALLATRPVQRTLRSLYVSLGQKNSDL